MSGKSVKAKLVREKSGNFINSTKQNSICLELIRKFNMKFYKFELDSKFF